MLQLQFSGATIAAGHFIAAARLTNNSGTVLQGLRLDVVKATEFYRENPKVKAKAGTKVEPRVVTRELKAAAVSPLYYGSLTDGESAEAASLDVPGMEMKPETVRIT